MLRPFLLRVYPGEVARSEWTTRTDSRGTDWTRFYFQSVTLKDRPETFVVAALAPWHYDDLSASYDTVGWCCTPPVIPKDEVRQEVSHRAKKTMCPPRSQPLCQAKPDWFQEPRHNWERE
jgi:hypothetical protein